MTFLSGLLLLTLLSAPIALSVVLSLRFLHFPDLTIDATVATSGGAFAMVLVATGSSVLALLAAVVAGFACGLITMLLHDRFGIGKLLSGILVLTALYSVDLRLMGGSNVAILGVESWFDRIDQFESRLLGASFATLDPFKLLALLALTLLITAILYGFFHSRPGIIIRGIGDNERAVARLGIPVAWYKFLGLGLANAIAGIGAALTVSNQGFADVGMGAGSLVLGLASLIIGERLVGPVWGTRNIVGGLLISAILGSAVYQGLWLLVLRLGLSPTDLKLFTALLVVASMAWGQKRQSPFYEGRAF